MKVCVVIPSQTMVHANFAVSLASLIGATPDLAIIIANPQGTYVHSNRTNGVRVALKAGVDYVLFYDSDMSVPPDSLRRLLSADKDIIGTNYVARQRPHPSLAVAKNGKALSGVAEVVRLPAGLLLIKTDVFRQIPEPWFCTEWFGSELGSEDYAFCDLALAHGYSVWVDADLSTQVIHWTDIGLRWTGDATKQFEMVTITTNM